MDRRVFDDRRRIGTVKAAINMYGERILDGRPSLKKTHKDLPEKSFSRTRELHTAKRDMGRYKESRRIADSDKAETESKLSTARETAKKDLASQIQESNSRLKAQMRDVEMEASTSRNVESKQYADVMRELEYVKQELSKLKLDMASVLGEKARAEKEMEMSSSKLWSYSSSAEALRKEIEKVNEEQVLIELARIEALQELGEIEAQREKEASQYSFAMEETRKKMKGLIEEIDHSKELEYKLAVTLSDVNVLQNELKLVKEMEKKVQRNNGLKHLGSSSRKGEELEGLPLIRSVTEELEAAKNELTLIKEEGFHFMASMDIIRNELKHVTKETSRLKKVEEKADLTVQNLNSKLLRAKSKLQSVSAAEEKAKSIVSNLSLTLEQLKTEGEMARKEKELICKETASIKAEIEKTESEKDLTEEKLQAAMQELETVKSSEAAALENLQYLAENAMRARASASQHVSSITISKFEYEYLTGRANRAEEIADKKVAAAQAWIEALKASEKEILLKIEVVQRDIREVRLEEEHEVYRTERSLSAKRTAEGELGNWRQKHKKNTGAENLQSAFPRKSMKSSNSTPSRRSKNRNSASPGVRLTPRSPFPIKNRKKVMPNLGKFFSGKRINRN